MKEGDFGVGRGSGVLKGKCHHARGQRVSHCRNTEVTRSCGGLEAARRSWLCEMTAVVSWGSMVEKVDAYLLEASDCRGPFISPPSLPQSSWESLRGGEQMTIALDERGPLEFFKK